MTRRPGRPPGVHGTETRRRILRSARLVFGEHGYDRASLTEIARTAGLTRNAIANYFPGKAELHVAVSASLQREAVTRILTEAARADGPVDRRIFAVFESAVALHRAEPAFARFLISSSVDATRHPELSDHSAHQFAEVRGYLLDTLVGAGRGGELAADIDVTATAQVLADLFWGLAMDLARLADPGRAAATMAALDRLIAAALRPPG